MSNMTPEQFHLIHKVLGEAYEQHRHSIAHITNPEGHDEALCSVCAEIKAARERAQKGIHPDTVRAVAQWAGQWDSQITGTEYKFEDIILGKFNLIKKRKMRKRDKPDPIKAAADKRGEEVLKLCVGTAHDPWAVKRMRQSYKEKFGDG